MIHRGRSGRGRGRRRLLHLRRHLPCLRAVGPAHYGRSHYAYGTGVSGPLSPAGRELLREFDRVGMILDVTHLCDQSMAEALDLFAGMLSASSQAERAPVR